MTRNYKKEWEKEKETKVTRLIKIDKNIFNKFKVKLDKNNKTLNGFFNEKILEYLKENEEEFKMEKLLKELNEELLNKEFTLVEMDNTILDLIRQNDIESGSLFDNEYYCMESLSCSYYTGEDECIYVAFEIIKKDEENNLYTEVKVSEIGEF